MHKMHNFHQDAIPLASDEEIALTTRRLVASTKVLGDSFGCQMVDLSRRCCGMEPLDAETSRWVTGPIIVHDFHGWGMSRNPMQSNPAFRTNIFCERIEIGMGLCPLRVGPTEWMCAAYDKAVGEPVEATFADVWIWASAQAMVRANPAVTMDSVYDGLGRSDGAPRLTQEDILHSPRYSSIYDGLAQAIRTKVAAHSHGDKIHRVRLPKRAAGTDFCVPDEVQAIAAE